MTKASDNEFPSILFDEQAGDPSTPASGLWRAYFKSDGLYVIDDAGSVTGPFVTGAGSGALVLLEQHTASASANLNFESFISGTYDEYLIEGVDIAPSANGAGLFMQCGTGGTPTYDGGANYAYMMVGRTFADAATTAGSSTSNGVQVLFALSNDATYGFGSFSLRATNLQSTTHRKAFHGTGFWTTSAPAHVAATIGGAWVTHGTAATAIRFGVDSGNIASGTIRVYGLVK